MAVSDLHIGKPSFCLFCLRVELEVEVYDTIRLCALESSVARLINREKAASAPWLPWESEIGIHAACLVYRNQNSDYNQLQSKMRPEQVADKHEAGSGSTPPQLPGHPRNLGI